MKRSSFDNLKTFYYFLFTFILILGILAFYSSCKSRSPTDANVCSNDALGAQSTTQTTTSSSTTTSVKPGQSPTNTTTLITSRNLTTTSTRTTTFSSSTTSTTTTSRKPTTTTSVGVCNLELCWVTVTINSEKPITIQYEETVIVNAGDEVKIRIWIKNTGTAATDNNWYAKCEVIPFLPGTCWGVHTYELLGSIKPNSKCYYSGLNPLQVNVSSSASAALCDIFLWVVHENKKYIFFRFWLRS
jgi:hypothetical protein